MTIPPRNLNNGTLPRGFEKYTERLRNGYSKQLELQKILQDRSATTTPLTFKKTNNQVSDRAKIETPRDTLSFSEKLEKFKNLEANGSSKGTTKPKTNGKSENLTGEKSSILKSSSNNNPEVAEVPSIKLFTVENQFAKVAGKSLPPRNANPELTSKISTDILKKSVRSGFRNSTSGIRTNSIQTNNSFFFKKRISSPDPVYNSSTRVRNFSKDNDRKNIKRSSETVKIPEKNVNTKVSETLKPNEDPSDAPVLTVQILIRKGESETLVIRRGQTVEQAVSVFCEKYGLRSDLQTRIVNMINEKSASFEV